MMNSRRTAVLVVARWLATHEFPHEMLPTSGNDRAFVQDIVYTVVRRFRPLRTLLGTLLKTWPKGELEALVLVGAAQILYMPDVPDFAAVNETVAAAKMSGTDKRLDRVVNGVLRNVIRQREAWQQKLVESSLAERESYPNALVKRWIARFGEADAEVLAKWHNVPAETWLAYPPTATEGRDSNGFVKLARGCRVMDVPGYADGAFIVQDPATAGAIRLLDVQPECSVLDYCAAPGGKTTQIAWRMGKGRLVAHEINERRCVRLQQNMARLHLDWVQVVHTMQGQQTLFDRVLVDAPCSNTGVLRRRPDARWRWDAEHLKQLVQLQAEVLEQASAWVAPGGRLVYSTCSNEIEENEAQIAEFLKKHSEFSELEHWESIPFQTQYDGAFACALVKRI